MRAIIKGVWREREEKTVNFNIIVVLMTFWRLRTGWKMENDFMNKFFSSLVHNLFFQQHHHHWRRLRERHVVGCGTAITYTWLFGCLIQQSFMPPAAARERGRERERASWQCNFSWASHRSFVRREFILIKVILCVVNNDDDELNQGKVTQMLRSFNVLCVAELRSLALLVSTWKRFIIKVKNPFS